MNKPTNYEKLTPFQKLFVDADMHQCMYPAFDMDRFLIEAHEQGEAYMKWAAGKPITVVNKSLKARRKSASISRKECDE